MILPYAARLVCLMLASFFLFQCLAGLSVNFLASSLVRFVRRFAARPAADLLLSARLFPSVAAVLVVAAICMPSYLWLEPAGTAEEVDFLCLSAALLGALGLALSIGRSLRAMRRSIQYQRAWKRGGSEAMLDGAACVVDAAGGLVAMGGIFHPRLFISREVVRELPPEQLAAALRHERAHQSARDNLKRLLFLLTPDVLPYGFGRFRGLLGLEREWSRFTEWAADDQAVGNDSRNSVALAAALVRVASLGPTDLASPLMTSLVDARDLEERVNRLLLANPKREAPKNIRPIFVTVALLAIGCVGVILTRPATLEAAHRLLEYLV